MQQQAEGVASLSLEEPSSGAPVAGRTAQNGRPGPSHWESVDKAQPPHPPYSAEEDRPPADKRRCCDPPPVEAPVG